VLLRGCKIGKTWEQPYSLIYSRASVKKDKHSPFGVDHATHVKTSFDTVYT
jgi:hypothetical protein